MNQKKFYIVSAEALPEIFVKVAEAKCMMQTGEVSTVGEATRRVGISRSAFYKYRDRLLPFQNMTSGRIVTFQLLIHDKPGTLQSILSIFTDCHSNIMTINSIVPTDGCAVVTISAETLHINIELEDFLLSLRNTAGVIKAEILAG